MGGQGRAMGDARKWRGLVCSDVTYQKRSSRSAEAARRHSEEGVQRAEAEVPAYALAWGNCLLRRCLDVVGSALLLALMAPAWLVIGLVIKLESPGPVFVCQLRGGRGEKPFRLRKFRSMRDSSGREENNSSGTRKERSMARTTRFGRILRRTSVDELPQLVNVLCGHMSLIGPRPFVLPDLEDPGDIARATGRIEPEAFEHWRRVRCQVRPGMTGLWQIKGRSSLPLEGLLRYDVEYVRRCSARLDLEILLKTIPAVVGGIGAF